MKSTPSAILTSESVTSCWKLERRDGTILGFTSHDVDLEIDSITYQAASGFSKTAYRQTADLAPDNQDIAGIFDSSSITDDDLAAGLYQGAQVWYFEVDWKNIAAGKHKLDYGVIGAVKRHRTGFSAEFNNLSSLLSRDIGRKYSRTCHHTLGDSGCGIELLPGDWQASEAVVLLDVRKATTYDNRRYVCTTAGTTDSSEPTWNTTLGGTTTDGTAEWTTYFAYTLTGTITSVTSRQKFTDTSRTEADNWFTYGLITWTGGLNNGLSMQVKQSLATGALTLVAPMPFDVQIGDTYNIVVGCNHQLKLPGDVWGTAYTGDCRIKFNTEDGGNAVNYGGFPEQTGNDLIMAGPQ
jgi:hypothetical protein